MVKRSDRLETEDGWETPHSAQPDIASENEASSTERKKITTNICDITKKCLRNILICCIMTIVCLLIGLAAFIYLIKRNIDSSSNMFVRDDFGSSLFDEGDSEFSLFDLFGMSNHIQDYSVDLSLEEIYFGYKNDFSFHVTKACPHCHGHGVLVHTCPSCGGSGVIQSNRGMTYCSRCRGQGMITSDVCNYCGGSGQIDNEQHIPLQIPAGAADGYSHVYKVDDGDKIRVVMHQKHHSLFERRGASLIMEVRLSLKEALMGKMISVTLLDGNVITVDLKKEVGNSGIQHRSEIIIKGYGLPDLAAVGIKEKIFGGMKFGDLIIIPLIELPNVLSKVQSDAVEMYF